MRSRTRNAAWPSLMCHTVGLMPSAASARTPPMPSTISCSIRVVRSPPYRRCAMPRSCSPLSARSVSSRYSATCPTRARQTLTATRRARRARPRRSSSAPASPATGSIGRSSKSESWYSACCVALAVDRLREVALAVEESHADERQPHVARGLAVIAGEDAEAAGVDRQALVQAELGAEVRDQIGRARATRSRSGAPARCDRCRMRTGPGCSSSRNTGSSAASSRRSSSMRFSSAFGLWPTASHSAGCSRAKSARVARSQLYQRLFASSSSRARRRGTRGLTSSE